jgi:hypothetical protein
MRYAYAETKIEYEIEITFEIFFGFFFKNIFFGNKLLFFIYFLLPKKNKS